MSNTDPELPKTQSDARLERAAQLRTTKLRRVRDWEARSHTRGWVPRALKRGITEIEHICDAEAADFPKTVRHDAAGLFQRALDKGLVRGRPTEATAGAVVFAAIRQSNVPYSLDEVGVMSRSSTDDVRSAYRYIKQELGLEIYPPEAEPFVGRFSRELSLSKATENQAYDLLQREENQAKLSGKSPAGLAAAAIYAASRLTEEKVAQLTLADIASVSAVTIRKRYQELLEIAGGQ